MELLETDSTGGPLTWGCYAMVPWAGRIRDGRFNFQGTSYVLPRNLGDHAIHGVGFGQPWEVLDNAQLGIDLEAPWPFGGRATQSFAITDDALRMTLSVEAADHAMPVVLGWHPCLHRELNRGDPAELSLEPKWMWHRASDGIPDGTRVSPSREPWDDTFGGVSSPPMLCWPRALQLSFEADCPAWVVYTERIDQICVEPQTGIPNAFNFDDPTVLDAGESMELTLTMRWQVFTPPPLGILAV